VAAPVPPTDRVAQGLRRSASKKIDNGYLLLRHEDMQLTLDAARGGSILEFNWRDRLIFRPTPRSAGTNPFALACFPMIPYANRIAHGRFDFGRRAVHLKRNWEGDPHPLHGQGWCSTWQVSAATASSVLLMFEGGADEWPWHYLAEQHLQLSQNLLSVRLSIENLARSPMPVMLGLHPYFCASDQAQLQASTPRVWLADNASLPIEEVATPLDWSFERARLIAAVPLDHCFTHWNGTAVIRWPDLRVDIRATNCRYLHVYAPSGGDFFCVEPLSAAVGALNRNEAAVVQPGERLEIQVSFAVGAA
jgi:aldose 1-epimerase